MTPTDGFVQPQPLGASAGKAGPPDGFMGLLDSILRRREDFFAEVFERTQLGVRNRSFLLSIITLSAFYGLTMGASAFTKGVEHGFLQMLASSIKVPALYLLTLLVCYPVLFIIL